MVNKNNTLKQSAEILWDTFPSFKQCPMFITEQRVIPNNVQHRTMLNITTEQRPTPNKVQYLLYKITFNILYASY